MVFVNTLRAATLGPTARPRLGGAFVGRPAQGLERAAWPRARCVAALEAPKPSGRVCATGMRTTVDGPLGDVAPRAPRSRTTPTKKVWSLMTRPDHQGWRARDSRTASNGLGRLDPPPPPPPPSPWRTGRTPPPHPPPPPPPQIFHDFPSCFAARPTAACQRQPDY